MSHYTEMEVKFLSKNETELVACLKEIFGQNAVEVHDNPVKIGGYDNSGNRKANIVVRKENVLKAKIGGSYYNDIGYLRNPNGTYTLYADPSDFPKAKQEEMVQEYTVKVAEKQMKYQGYAVQRQKQKDGTVKLIASKFM
jgi:hypothetical protein